MRKRTKLIVGPVMALAVGLGLQPVVATGSSAGSSSGYASGHASTATTTGLATAASSASTAATSTSATTATTGATGALDSELVVGLGDSLIFRPASWFRRTCRSGLIGACINAGVTGNTTSQMYARLSAQVLAADPDAMVLMGGANDIRHGTTTAQIVHRLKRIVAAARAAGVPVVISTVPPQDRHGSAVLALNRAIRAYAASAGLPLLDMYRAVGTARGTYQTGLSDDGLHPNRAGFARMARISKARLPGLVAAARAA